MSHCRIVAYFGFLLLFSCQHFGAGNFAENMARHHGLTHIQSGCKLADFKGEIAYSTAGSMCLFFPDGSSIVNTYDRKLIKYDKKFNELWKYDIELNHQFKVSEFEDGYLAIQTLYYPTPNGTARYDAIVFINPNGHITKSYNFKKYLDELNRKFEPWDVQTTDGSKMFEYTHLNSIAETYKVEDGKKVHTGYVAHDRFSKEMFFFDVRMEKITKIIEMEDRSSHDVTPISETEFVFYMNHDAKRFFMPDPKFRSSIQIYNSEKNSFRKLYENDSQMLASKACSSVQYFPPADLVIFHSNCPSAYNAPGKKAALEFVDLNAGKAKVLQFDSFLDKALDARLVEAASFLKNIGSSN